MTYQIAKSSQAQMIEGQGVQPLYVIRPSRDVRLTSLTVQMLLKGHMASSFKMRINVYSGTEQGRLLFRSHPVSIEDVERSGDYYFNLRFDFPLEGNIWSVDKDHLIEFEIYDGYYYDLDNYLALILDHFGGQAFFGTDIENLGQENNLSHVVSIFFDVREKESEESFFLVQVVGSRMVIEPYEEIEVPGKGKIYRFLIDKELEIFGAESWLFGGFIHNFFSMEEKPINLADPTDYSGYYDKESGQLDLFLGLFGTLGTTVVIHYSIFLTDTIGRATKNIGLNLVRPDVYWEPRITETPTLSYSQQDILGGIMSTSTNPLTISNEDGWFDKYLGPLHTFLNRGVYIKRCKGSPDNVLSAFLGAISSISGDDSTLTISINDISSIFDFIYSDNKPQKWGELGSLSMDEKSKSVTIPRLFGRSGPYNLYDYSTKQVDSSGQVVFIKSLEPSKMIKAECITFSPTIANTTNRAWGICFGPTDLVTRELDIVDIFEDTNGTFKEVIFQIAPIGTELASDYLQAGDTIRVGASNYAIVNKVLGDQVYVWPYTTIFIGATKIYRETVSALVIKKDDALYYPIAGRDYTMALDPSGFVGIIFKNNFEATFTGLGVLDPASVEVYAKVWNDNGDYTASGVLKKVMGGVGLEPAVDFEPVGVPNPYQWDGSMGAVAYYPNPPLSFTIPFIGSNDMPSYREVMEKILVSSCSYIYMDNDFKWRWNSYLNTHFRDENFIPTGDYSDNRSGVSTYNPITQKAYSLTSKSYDYQDVYTTLEVTCEHNPYNPPLYRFERDTLRRFYGFNKPYKMESLCMTSHYLYDWFETTLLRLLSGRKATFSISVKDYKGESVGDTVRADIRGMQSLRGLVTSKDDSELGTTILINDVEKFPKDIT